MKQGIVTCSQLLKDQGSLDTLGLSKKKHSALLEELMDICA